MKGTILVSGVVSSLVSITGTIVALNVLAPAVVEAQQNRIRAENVAVVDGSGTQRVQMEAGPGAYAGVRVLAPDGQQSRWSLYTGSGAPDTIGTLPEVAALNLWDADGQIVGRFVTLSPESGVQLVLRDREERNRVRVAVDGEGNPSIRLLDANDNVVWSAP